MGHGQVDLAQRSASNQLLVCTGAVEPFLAAQSASASFSSNFGTAESFIAPSSLSSRSAQERAW
jgi:hypothetical protein